ncbi:MAG: DUF6348 family protein [Clostridium sp.]
MELYNRKELSTFLNNDDTAISLLNSIVKEGVKKNNELFISSLNLRISVKILKVTNQYAHGIFIVKHNDLKEDLVDSVAAIGEGMQDSIKNVVWIFAMGTLSGLIDALKDEDGNRITIKCYDKVKHYKTFRSQQVSIGKINKVETIDFWSVIGGEITKRLSNKKIQWVKVYAAKTKGGVNCECNVDGILNVELTDILKSIANKWVLNDTIYSEKQYFYFIQDGSTFVNDRFTKSEIEDFTEQAFKIYSLTEDEEEYRGLVDKFYNLTDDENLSTELFCFIPEMLCEQVCNEVTYLDEMVMKTPEKSITVYKNQVTNYNYIKNSIINLLKKKEPTRKEIKNILRFSASMKSINDALDNGNKVSELMVTKITYNVSGEYIPF